MRAKVSIILLLVFSLFLPEMAVAQETPNLRFVNIESIQNTIYETDYASYPAVLVNYTFALTNIQVAGDRVNFKFWLGDGEIADWWTSFSGDPPHLKGAGGSGDFIMNEIITAEFPYASEMIEGRTYYFYRIHVWYNRTLPAKETAFFGAAFNTQPTLQGSSLIQLKLKKIGDDGVVNFKAKILHESG